MQRLDTNHIEMHARQASLTPRSCHKRVCAAKLATNAWFCRNKTLKGIGSSYPHSKTLACQAVGTRERPAPPTIQAPRSIHDVSNGKILGFGADLSPDHPGFHDEAYKQRRVAIAQAASEHRIGEPIPDVVYTPEEVATWGAALRHLTALYPALACKEFLRSLPKFDFREDQVPQLQQVSEALQASTGWAIRPVAGLMHPRDFLNGLAFKYFHSTQYMRHPSKPYYTPEPDVVHELLGHVAMLADPAFSDLVQTIGLASLHASDAEVWHLTRVYWFSVEFGVVREGNAIKAFGAGILSSIGELEHMAAGRAALEPLNPFAKQPKMSYKDGYQQRYFVLDSFEDGCQLLKRYAASLQMPPALRHGPLAAQGQLLQSVQGAGGAAGGAAALPLHTNNGHL